MCQNHPQAPMMRQPREEPEEGQRLAPQLTLGGPSSFPVTTCLSLEYWRVLLGPPPPVTQMGMRAAAPLQARWDCCKVVWGTHSRSPKQVTDMKQVHRAERAEALPDSAAHPPPLQPLLQAARQAAGRGWRATCPHRGSNHTFIFSSKQQPPLSKHWDVSGTGSGSSRTSSSKMYVSVAHMMPWGRQSSHLSMGKVGLGH